MRPIDADVLPKHEIKDEKAYINPSYARGWNDAIRSVYLYAPKIDAEPVRRGHWIDTGEIWTDMYTADEDPIYKCSVCNVEVIGGGMAYCSNCGARMEEEL